MSTTQSICPRSVRISCPLTMSQIFAAWSDPPVTSRWPSGLNAMHCAVSRQRWSLTARLDVPNPNRAAVLLPLVTRSRRDQRTVGAKCDAPKRSISAKRTFGVACIGIDEPHGVVFAGQRQYLIIRA